MGNESSDQAFADVGDVIAANLRRLRTARRMSLATLATRADVAKATLANLEQGRGNPTIETLWSLALGLGVAFSDLLEDRRETTTVVVRAQQGRAGARIHPGGQLDAAARPDGEPVRRRAERPHQRCRPRRRTGSAGFAGQAPLQPVDAYLLVAGAAGQFGQRHGIRGDCPRVESPRIGSRVSHVTLARQNSYNHADRASRRAERR